MSSGLLRAVVGISLVALWGCGGEVADLEFVSITPTNPKLSEPAVVTFKLIDYRGLPLAGQNVTFRLSTDRSGLSLNPLSATSRKGSGEVETTIIASNRVTSVRVIAKIGNIEVFSPPLAFAGSDANGRQLTFQCGELAGKASGGIHAIGAYDPSRYLIAGVKVKCFAHVADRNGDGLEGASVSFITEAGTIGPSEVSVSDVIGNAEILYKTSLPLPKEVAPGVFTWNPNPSNDANNTGEFLVPFWMEPYRWTTNPIGTADTGIPPLVLTKLDEPRRPDPIRRRPDNGQPYQNNPRDNLVAMIAMTSGEEGFTDENNDGTWQTEEAFDDLTEPFVDSNDNGTWDPDEKFVDVNENKKWDGKNGTWDRNTTIWVQERILWTGIPNAEDIRTPSAINPVPCVRGVQPTGGGQIQIGCKETVEVDFIIADPWFNSLARNGGNDGCGGESNEVVNVVGGNTGAAFTYPAVTIFSFGLQDALDRKPAEGTTPPAPSCFPPATGVCSPNGLDCYTFAVAVACEFTASPEEGHRLDFVTWVRGRIFKNNP